MTKKKQLLWTEENVRAFDALYDQGYGEGKIARVMNAPLDFIHARMTLVRKHELERYLRHAELAAAQRSDGTFWTPEREQQLRALVEEKLSSGRIAEVLGCTRNAVIGKCCRLGLKVYANGTPTRSLAPGRVLQGRVPSSVKRRAQPRPAPSRAAPVVPLVPTDAAAPALMAPDVASNLGPTRVRPPEKRVGAGGVLVDLVYDPGDFPAAWRKTLAELGNRHCRFAVGDPREPGFFFFCGRPEADLAQGRPYCPACSARAYTAASTRGLAVYKPRFYRA
jgi:GcrA cell cycle regulator